MINRIKALATTILILFCQKDDSATRKINFLSIWNVGQGSWATAKSGSTCLHFDIGGEFAPTENSFSACKKLQNQVFYSHWDNDHIKLTKKARNFLPNLCTKKFPGGPGSRYKKRYLRKHAPFCRGQSSKTSNTNFDPLDESSDRHWQEIIFDRSSLQKANRRSTNKLPQKRHDRSRRKPQKTGVSNNDQSRIFVFNKAILLPGDSSKKFEKIWIDLIPEPGLIKYLMLGHHGSKTSTSQELLDKLPNLKMAIASARYKRYRHPHRKVVELLNKRHIPVLRTEDWGNIHIEFNALQ